VLAYSPYGLKWKMLTAGDFHVHFDGFFDSVKFVIFADCMSSICFINFPPSLYRLLLSVLGPHSLV